MFVRGRKKRIIKDISGRRERLVRKMICRVMGMATKRPKNIDNERLNWIRCYEVPCHTWPHKFFEFITFFMVVYVCLDEETSKQSKMDVVRILVRTKYILVLNETFKVEINKDVFKVMIIENSQGLMRITIPKVKDNGPSRKGDGTEKKKIKNIYNHQ